MYEIHNARRRGTSTTSEEKNKEEGKGKGKERKGKAREREEGKARKGRKQPFGQPANKQTTERWSDGSIDGLMDRSTQSIKTCMFIIIHANICKCEVKIDGYFWYLHIHPQKKKRARSQLETPPSGTPSSRLEAQAS